MIHALVIVRKGDEDRYLGSVLNHASRWADRIYCALEPGAPPDLPNEWGESGELKISCGENDGMAKSQAWLDMSHCYKLTAQDHVAVVKPTEIFQNPDAIKRAVKDYPEYTLSAKVHHLWDINHIRVDGQWEPKDEAFLTPWRVGGFYPDFRLRAGRLPTYHYTIPPLGVSVSDVLDYDVRTFEDKLLKWNWFQSVGAEEYYSFDHIASLKRHPTLRPWLGGAILGVESVEAV